MEIILSAAERVMIHGLDQALELGHLNRNMPKFTTGDAARAIRAMTGKPIDARIVGDVLNRAGVYGDNRYRRLTSELLAVLPDLVSAAENGDAQQPQMIR